MTTFPQGNSRSWQRQLQVTWFERPRPTATCNKAGTPNDACPYGQAMSTSPNDVAFGNDVVPSVQWANITPLSPENKYGITHYTLQGKIVCKIPTGKERKLSIAPNKE